jgi:hypothetical protein
VSPLLLYPVGNTVEGFQKWIIQADYLRDNPMDTPRIKFAEPIKRSRQIIAGVFFLFIFLWTVVHLPPMKQIYIWD